MKRLAVFLISIIVLSMMTCTPAFVQDKQNPASVPPYFIYTIAAAKSYTHSQADTLPQPAAADGAISGLKIGGTSKATFTITATDSMLADIVVKYCYRGASTWTSAYVDSVKLTAAGKKEVILRVGATNNLASVDCTVIMILTQRAVSAYTATYGVVLNWKP